MRRLLILAVVFSAVVSGLAQGQEEKNAAKILEHFVGVWKTEATTKPTQWYPQGGEKEIHESISWALKDRFIMGRELNRSTGMKTLWLMTHDPTTNTYPFWFFNTAGVASEWRGTWDNTGKTFNSKMANVPPGWTSAGTYHFPNKNTMQMNAWVKDQTGTLLLDLAAKKTRQSLAEGEKTLADWSRPAKPDENLPPELKILDRLAGTWDVQAISKPAEWTPKEVRTTSKVIRKWVLNGRFLEDASEVSDGTAGYSIFTYDPKTKAYKSWWFNSLGHTSKSTGQWDAATQTIAFKSDLPDGLTSRGSVRFIDNDRHDFQAIIRDATGKLFFHGEWHVTRHKQ